MKLKSIIPLTATIPPGTTACVSTKPRSGFRPERLLVSPHSFPLSLERRMRTWLPVTIGSLLGRVHRGLAKFLHVDLHATHTRREYVSVEYAQTHAEEVFWGRVWPPMRSSAEYTLWDQSKENDEESEGRPFILVQTPLNRRERLLAPLGRASRRLSQIRLRWQQAQLATLLVRNIIISNQPQFVDGTAPLPADLFAAPSIDISMNFNAPSCMVGHEIKIDVHNGNRRECQLMMTLIGISEDSRIGKAL
jgi:hypothetical protein